MALTLAQPVLHPLQRLPADLLAEIFVHCIPGTPIGNDWRPYIISDRRAPLLLCRVCSSWRSLAISTPRLWQTFTFEWLTWNPRLSDRIRAWLKRSGTLSLTIRLRFRLGWLYSGGWDEIFTAVSEFSPRWGCIQIIPGRHVPWPAVGVLSNLHDFDADQLPISDFPFTFAPNLKRLSLNKLPPDTMASISSIPWGRLQDLLITLPVPIYVFLELFRYCPLLEVLAIFVTDHDGESSLRRLTHSSLRKLSLNISRSSGVAADYLTLPALKELLLNGRPRIPCTPDCLFSVLGLLTRSKCALYKLSLTQSSVEPHHLLDYLQHPSCQTLMSLTIDNGSDRKHGMVVIDDKVLSRLTLSEKQDTPPLCPGLAEIQFKKCYRPDLNSHATTLGRMVHSRCFRQASDHRLRSLGILTYHSISQEDKEMLQLARDEAGLQLSYTFELSADDDDDDDCEVDF